MGSVDAKIVLNDLYETETGIFNHANNKPNVVNYRPMASVAMHPGEEMSSNDLLEEFIRTFIYQGIGPLFNISLPEFLNYSKPVSDMLIRIATEVNAKKAATLDGIKNAMSNEKI